VHGNGAGAGLRRDFHRVSALADERLELAQLLDFEVRPGGRVVLRSGRACLEPGAHRNDLDGTLLSRELERAADGGVIARAAERLVIRGQGDRLRVAWSSE
jgi:hypothetical protein